MAQKRKDKTIEQSNRTDQMVDVAMGAVHDVSQTPVQQYLSDVPNGTQAESVRSKIKLTPKSTPFSLKRNFVIASHSLNPPLRDGLITVRSLYLTIRDLAFNYQQKHDDAFFEAWPDLLIMTEVEKQAELSTTYLRRNYKKHARALAHHIWHYINARTMQLAALANIMALSRFQGNEMMASIAYATRWGVINSSTPLESRLPVPKGLVKYITDNTMYAVGKTSYGADILSIPMWNVDIFGNRGCHSIPQDNITSSRDENGYEGANFDIANIRNDNVDAVRMQNLIVNTAAVINSYSSEARTFYVQSRDGSKKIQWSPYMPRIENGAFRVEDDGTTKFSSPLNLDNFVQRIETVKGGNILAGIAWNNYYYWLDYTRKYFPEMLDENSDMYEFTTRDLPLFESCPTVKSIYDAIRNRPNVNANDLLKRMVYKGNNEATTATIVKWMPLIGGGSAGGDINKVRVENYDANYARYDVDIDDIAKMVAQAKSFPTNTPGVFGAPVKFIHKFGGADQELQLRPFVVNCVPAVGAELVGSDDTAKSISLSPAPVGKFSVLVDLASSSGADTEGSKIDTLGVSAAFAKQYITSGDALVYEEDPSQIHFAIDRLIDNTDPYQCGFNLMIAADGVDRDEASRFFTDKENFNIPSTLSSDQEAVVTFSNGTKARMHPAIPEYLKWIGYAFIFMGSGIFDHPLLQYARDGAGNPVYATSLLSQDSDTVKTSAVNKYLNAAFANETESETDQLKQMVKLGVYLGTVSDDTVDYGVFSKNAILGVNRTIYQFLFAPQFGPVKPVTMQENMAGIMPVSPFGDALEPYQVNEQLKIRFGDSDLSKLSITFAGYAHPVLYNPMWDAAKRWVPFIESVKVIPSVEVEQGMFVINDDNAPSAVHFIGASGYYRQFFNHTLVRFMGSEDTYPFDKVRSDKFKEQYDSLNSIAGQTYQAPEQDILSEPRRSPSATRGPNRNLDSSHPKPNFGTESRGGRGNKPHTRTHDKTQGDSAFAVDALSSGESSSVERSLNAGSVDNGVATALDRTKATSKDIDAKAKGKTDGLDSVLG